MSFQNQNDEFETQETVGVESSDTEMAELVQRTRIHRYLILELIGKGGMGAVYKAYDPELDRRIAIKVMALAPLAGETTSKPQARLMREAQALAKLNHRVCSCGRRCRSEGCSGSGKSLICRLLPG